MKKEETNKILSEFRYMAKPYIKLAIDNILLPSWNQLGLLGKIYTQAIKTKECPTGQIYDEIQYRTVIRVLGGKVLINNMVDAYTWDTARVAKNIGNAYPIGVHDGKSLMNLSAFLFSITDLKEREEFADMMANSTRDFLVCPTPAETRKVIIVDTAVGKALGWTICNEWCEEENCKIEYGDAIVVSEKGYYRIGREEFALTHKPSELGK